MSHSRNPSKTELPTREKEETPEASSAPAKQDKKEKKEKPAKGVGKPEAKMPQAKAGGGKKKKMDGAALIGIDVSKDTDFSEWYQQVLLKGDMLDYYDISGCYI